MKNNILNRFAFKDLKIHKKDSMSLLIMIFISSFIIFTISFVSQTYSKEKYEEYQYKHGTYTYYTYDFDNNIEGTSIEIYDKFVPLTSFDYCVFENYGIDFNGIRLMGLNGNPDVVGIHLTEGRFPENKNEIILNVKYLEQYNLDYAIGDVFDLLYRQDFEPFYKEIGENIETRVKVVGFIEGTSDYPLIVKLDNPINCQLFFATPHNAKVTGDRSTTNDAQMHLYRNYNVDDLYSISSVAYKLGIVEVLTVIISMILIYSISVISFDKKQRDYTLLRSIGITQKQLYYIIFIQTLMLSFIPLILSIVIHYILSVVMNVETTVNLYLWNIFKIIFIVFIGYFLPAHSITRQSLTGSFEGSEFQVFYYQYKKRHIMRPFYLGYRQLISSKKSTALKIILLSLVCIQILDIVRALSIEINKIEKTENRYNVAYYIKDGYTSSKDNWDAINEHASHIYALPYVELSGENRFPIYCDNENVKDYYGYEISPKEGECLINGYNLITFKDNFSDTFVFDEYTDYVVLNKADYDRYKQQGEYMNLILVFDSIQQRTTMFKNMSDRLNDIFEDSAVEIDYLNYDVLNKDYLLNYNEDSIANINFNYLPNNYVELSKIEEINEKSYILTMSLIVIYVFLSSLDIFHQKEDIGTYQLIGMSFKEIKSIYFYKSLIISFVSIVCAGGCYLLKYYEYARYQNIYQYFVIPPVITIIIVFVTIWFIVYPLSFILKKDAFENKLTRD